MEWPRRAEDSAHPFGAESGAERSLLSSGGASRLHAQGRASDDVRDLALALINRGSDVIEQGLPGG
jgi:hypothetical protein